MRVRWGEAAVQLAAVAIAAAAFAAFVLAPGNTAPASGAAPDAVTGTGTSQAGAKLPLPTADALRTTCTGSPIGSPACVQAELETVLAGHGIGPTFDLLGAVAATDKDVEREQHMIAHHLGRQALAFYPSTQDALRECPTTMASGCFHGALEAHFAAKGPPRTAADVSQLCSAADGMNRQFQCLHGLGHGLTMVASHDLPLALSWCDLFAGGWEQQSCGGGVFMENVQGDTSMDHAHEEGTGMAHGGGTHHGGSNSTWVRMKADDLQWPCNAVAQRWWHSCYWLQSSLYIKLGLDWRQSFAACDQAPPPYDGVCYESMGRDISGWNLRDGPAVIRDCKLGNETRLARCIYGAVQEFVNNVGDPAPGFAFCPTVPETTKADCYRAVGVMVQSLFPATADREAQCDKSEAAYVASCRMGAGLPSQGRPAP